MKLTDNPLTSLWSGKLKGFLFKVVDGKQVITSIPHRKKTGITEKQVEGRSIFKLSSQYVAVWLPMLRLNLVMRFPDKKKAQSFAISVAYGVARIENHAAVIYLEDFERAINNQSHQNPSVDLLIHFNAANQDIIAPDGHVVTYQVVAFDSDSNPIGFNTVTYVSDGTAKLIDLPAIKGDAVRYDIMAFNTAIGQNTSFDGPIGNISGNDPDEVISAQTYSVLVVALEKAKGTIYGIQSGSFLVTP